MNKLSRPAAPLSYHSLDPCSLGRPIHLLPGFCAKLQEDLAELFRSTLNRRYRARFQVGTASMAPMGEPVQPGRWLTYGGALGRLSVAFERKMVLAVLAYRYGLAESNAPTESSPETATEERLAATLGLQLVNLLAARIESGQTSPQHVFNAVTPVAPARGTWVVTVTVEELAHGIESRLHFALDDAWMARLLHTLAPMRDNPTESVAAPALAARLQLTLTARLLQKDIELGQLLDIRVGDVIPVSFGAADVLVDESILFSATVAEHKGKLCLTSIEDIR